MFTIIFRRIISINLILMKSRNYGDLWLLRVTHPIDCKLVWNCNVHYTKRAMVTKKRSILVKFVVVVKVHPKVKTQPNLSGKDLTLVPKILIFLKRKVRPMCLMLYSYGLFDKKLMHYYPSQVSLVPLHCTCLLEPWICLCFTLSQEEKKNNTKRCLCFILAAF